MGRVTLGDLLNKPVVYAVLDRSGAHGNGNTIAGDAGSLLFNILGGLAIPLMLLTLGHTLATLQVGHILRGCYPRRLSPGSWRWVSPSLLTQLFGFQGIERQVFILQSLMPVSVATYLWVETYYTGTCAGGGRLHPGLHPPRPGEPPHRPRLAGIARHRASFILIRNLAQH